MANILWFAFLASTMTYFIVLFFIVSDPQPLELDAEVFVFAFLGVTNAALSFFLPKMITPKTADNQQAAASQKFEAQDFTPFVARMALAESVACFGIVVAVLKSNVEVAAPFLVVAFFCILMGKPKAG